MSVLMDRSPHKRGKTVPIRKRRHGEGSSSSLVSFLIFNIFITFSFKGSNSSNLEGTFISLPRRDSEWAGLDFINRNFREDENEDVVKVTDLQTNEKPPLFLLFPDLGEKEKERLARVNSTTQITQILVGQKADFSLLKPSKKLNPEQVS